MNQIGSFYTGAMGESADIEIAPIWDAVGADLVVISAYDPAAMVQAQRRVPCQGFALRRRPVPADHSDGRPPNSTQLIEGAALLFTNDYEKQLLESKTGLSSRGDRRSGRGAGHHARIRRVSRSSATISRPVHVPVAKERSKTDPTGVGDAFRGGFLTGSRLGPVVATRSAEVGSLLATMVLEIVGTQEYAVTKDEFGARLAESYGDECAAEVLPHLG